MAMKQCRTKPALAVYHLCAMRRLLPAYLCVIFGSTACKSEPSPPVIGQAASTSVRTVASVEASTVAIAGSTVPETNTPLPSEITLCEANTNQFGDWLPTVDEVARVAKFLDRACLDRNQRERAVVACAKKVGRSSVTVGKETRDGRSSCQESFASASWHGRRWVVFGAYYREGATVDGGAVVVELNGNSPARYFENVVSEADCSNPRKPLKGAPADWATLPADLTHFLCGRS
jgi:hypothetical protein